MRAKRLELPSRAEFLTFVEATGWLGIVSILAKLPIESRPLIARMK